MSDQDDAPQEQPADPKPADNPQPVIPERGRIPEPDPDSERFILRKGEDPSRPFRASNDED